jgi:hypothetical protein
MFVESFELVRGEEFRGGAGSVVGEDLEGGRGEVSSSFSFLWLCRVVWLVGLLIVFWVGVVRRRKGAGLPCKQAVFALTMRLWDQP